MKFDPTKVIDVCRRILEEGEYASVLCKREQIDDSEVRVWKALYRVYGPSVFYNKQEFSSEYRTFIIETMLREDLSLTETCVRYKILRRTTLRNWIRTYSKSNPMEKRNKNCKPIGVSRRKAIKLSELEEELRYLRAENAFLKKLQALIQEEERKDSKG